MNLIRLIFGQARIQPETIALADLERRYTFRALAETVARTAGHLAALGVRPGDRIGICVGDHAGHLVVMLAAGWLGAVIVPIDWRARPEERARIAALLGLARVIGEPGNGGDIPLDAAWHRAVERAPPVREAPDDWNLPVLLAPTAGTTGIPKYTAATHLQLYFRVAICNHHRPRTPPARFLSSLPLYFAGSHLRCRAHLLWGDGVVVGPALFSAAEYVAAVERHGATVGQIVPTILRQLLALAGTREIVLPGMGLLHCVGAPLLAEEKIAAARHLTPNFIDLYGSSACGGIARLTAKDLPHAAASVGRPYPTVAVEIVDEQDRPLGPNAVGRLRVRGPGLGAPVTHADLPGAAAEEFRGGWYYPGELAAMDERAYLYLTGRLSDVIVRGGAKIHPVEIEAVLQLHADVAECAVLGVPGPGNEEAIVAFVVARRLVEAGDLLAHCRARLTGYKVPREFHLVASLPRNAAGKVVKAELAATLRNDGAPARRLL